MRTLSLAVLLGISCGLGLRAQTTAGAPGQDAHPSSFPAGYWERRQINDFSCGRARPVNEAFMRVADVKAAEIRVREILSTFKAVEMSRSCGGGYGIPGEVLPGTQPFVIDVWVAEGDLGSVKAKLSALEKSLEWRDRSSVGGLPASIEERWRFLKEELSAHEALLARTPHVLSLVRAEIRRLEPYAKSYLDSKGKAHLRILAYVPKAESRK